MAQGILAGEVVTGTGAGRVAFVDAADIAAVAARALLDEHPHNTDHVITGPEALSYAEACALVTELTGRMVRHLDVTTTELADRLAAAGYPVDFAVALATLDEGIRRGAEDRTTDTVRRITGREPRSLRDFLGARR